MTFNSICNHASDYYCGHNCHGKRNNLAAKEINSQQKKKTPSKRKNLAAKEKTSLRKEKTRGKRKNLTAKRLTTAKVEDSYKSVYDFAVQLK